MLVATEIEAPIGVTIEVAIEVEASKDEEEP